MYLVDVQSLRTSTPSIFFLDAEKLHYAARLEFVPSRHVGILYVQLTSIGRLIALKGN